MNKETSSRVSTIAAEILKMTPEETDDLGLLKAAQTLAGSVLSQDETPGPRRTTMQNEIHPTPSEFTLAEIAADPILHFFHYAHLPPTLQATSKAFFGLAHQVVNSVPRNAERTVALRKLLEAKDAAVRANLPAPLIGGQRDFLDDKLELGEAKETGGHSEDRDGPLKFDG